MTAILHIEHPITDLGSWKKAFDQFSEMRAASGVIRHRLQRPLHDDRFIIIDLEFDSAGEAERFLMFLQREVWSSREHSPALVGTPETKLLEPVPAD
jgi:hypothetical protein